MVDKLDDNGDPQKMKLTRRTNGSDTKQERKLIKTYAEFYITNEEEIKNIINGFAVNADNFNYKQYLDVDAVPQPDPRALPSDKATNLIIA